MLVGSYIKEEWLEADGLGGYASGTVGTIRTRRYHALLICALTPPTGRVSLVKGFDVWVETPWERLPLSSQQIKGDQICPDGVTRMELFELDPWPIWTFRLEDGSIITQEVIVRKGSPVVLVCWRLAAGAPGVKLYARPQITGTSAHLIHRENPDFNFSAQVDRERVLWRPYDNVPGIVALTNAEYVHEPMWYRDVLYCVERERGYDYLEDLGSPGTFRWDLSASEAVCVLSPDGVRFTSKGQPGTARRLAREIRCDERRRRSQFHSPLELAGDAYLVRRGRGKSIIAGYPWFSDWGRDTFISLRGLCLATGRINAARQILTEWAGTVHDGMVPNRFVDAGDVPEFNAVDASLWYIIAVREYLATVGNDITDRDKKTLLTAVEKILSGYAHGTHYAIKLDEADSLISEGVPGVQLTWMDAKMLDWVVTPRVGKPVEVQALWLNALRFAGHFSDTWKHLYDKGLKSFHERFWYKRGGYLYDVIDVDHEPGRVDTSFRPNQLFTIGGLPHAILTGVRARRVVDLCEQKLWTPLGPRSLAPDDPSYRPYYRGPLIERDGAYHQGTVWPWLAGPFVEAWLRVRKNTRSAKLKARELFLEPLLESFGEAGLGHISEIADGAPPHIPGGCPFQAWSVAEALRLERVVLADGAAAKNGKAG